MWPERGHYAYRAAYMWDKVLQAPPTIEPARKLIPSPQTVFLEKELSQFGQVGKNSNRVWLTWAKAHLQDEVCFGWHPWQYPKTLPTLGVLVHSERDSFAFSVISLAASLHHAESKQGRNLVKHSEKKWAQETTKTLMAYSHSSCF